MGADSRTTMGSYIVSGRARWVELDSRSGEAAAGLWQSRTRASVDSDGLLQQQPTSQISAAVSSTPPRPLACTQGMPCLQLLTLHSQANRVTDKLTHISDRIYCCRSGSAADTQAVADMVSYHLGMVSVQHDEAPRVAVAAQLFQEICYSNKDRLSAGIIVAGWDKRSGGSVYNVPLGGGLFKQPWAIGGASGVALCTACADLWRQAPARRTSTATATRRGRRAGVAMRYVCCSVTLDTC